MFNKRWRGTFDWLAGIFGFANASVTWFLAGSWYTRRLGKKYPPVGDIGIPSEQVMDAALATLFLTPIAGIIGCVVGVFVSRKLLFRRSDAEAS